MKKILAVSGGIDSVVMLHLLRDDKDVVVAHFDHGIRPNSADDCDFVGGLARLYRKEFFFKRAKLGNDCSEESARIARYAFLKQLAKEQGGKIYTAHHADDLVESVAINLLRGTGWRGLAALNNPDIERPLLSWTKKDIYKYAAEKQLCFRLDQTNIDEKYLRNRVREKLTLLGNEDKKKIYDFAIRQRDISKEVDAVISEAISSDNYPRSLMNYDDDISMEFLRSILAKKNISLTRPQLKRAIDAIRNYSPNKKFSLNRKYYVKNGRYNFYIEPVKIATEV